MFRIAVAPGRVSVGDGATDRLKPGGHPCVNVVTPVKSVEEIHVNAASLSRRQFIRIGTAVGVGAAGASVLAGCGNSGTASLPAGNTGEEERPGVRPGEVIAAADDIEPNSAVPFTNAETGQPEVLVRLPKGRLVAYSAVCTHQGCTVSYQPESRKLACPCHGGVFAPARDAAVVSGPPPRPLPQAAFRVREGQILLA